MGCSGSKEADSNATVAPDGEAIDDLPSPDTRKFRQARDSVVVTKSQMVAGKPGAAAAKSGEFKKLPRDSIAIAKRNQANAQQGRRPSHDQPSAQAVAAAARERRALMTVQDEDDEDETGTQDSNLELAVSTKSPTSVAVSPTNSLDKKKQPPGPPPGRPKSNTHTVSSASESLQLSPDSGQRSISESNRAQLAAAKPRDSTAPGDGLRASGTSSAVLSTTASSHGGETENRSVFSQLSPSTADGTTREHSGEATPRAATTTATKGGGHLPMASPTSMGSLLSASSAPASGAAHAQQHQQQLTPPQGEAHPPSQLAASAVASDGSRDLGLDV